MTINHKMQGLISIASNSPGAPTGYGQQAQQLAERLLKTGFKVAAMSNYGLEGSVETLKLRTGKIPHYPRGLHYSDDVLPMHHKHFKAKHPDLKDVILTLYDCWVYRNPQLAKYQIFSWVPLDHITPPPAVIEFLSKENVTPVTMAQHGKEQLDAAGIANTFIPHAIDTKIYKPTETISGTPGKQFIGVEGKFLVGMIAANKSNGLVHRKAFAENLLAFSLFRKKRPDAVLYLHAEPSKKYGGFDLLKLLNSCDIPADSVIFPNPVEHAYGMSQQHMAGLYSALDVLLAPSYGEGFGIPTIEAQACGTRAIASNWAASKDLVAADGFLVSGQPFWDEPQAAWFQIPSVDSIVNELESAYDCDREPSETSREFALQFDADKVYQEKWLPFLGEYFAVQ